LQLIVGVAPKDILSAQNLTWDKGFFFFFLCKHIFNFSLPVYGYTNTGKSQNGTCGTSFGVGDRIGVLLNTEFMTVSFLKNDMLQVLLLPPSIGLPNFLTGYSICAFE